MGFGESFKRGFKRGFRRRSPMLAATLNFGAWGLGYLYGGRRRLLGFALFFFISTALWGGFAMQTSAHAFYTALGAFAVAWVLVSVALARDAYIDAKRRNAEVNRIEKEDK